MVVIVVVVVAVVVVAIVVFVAIHQHKTFRVRRGNLAQKNLL